MVMPIEVSGNLGGFLDEFVSVIDVGIKIGLRSAARYYYDAIMKAFRDEGPGWKKLSKLTIATKKLSGSPTPEKILREFSTMRNSIEIRDDIRKKDVAIKGDVIADVYKWVEKPGGELEFKKVGTIKDIKGWYVATEYSYSIGLFGDSYKAVSLRQVGGLPGQKESVEKFKQVNRAIMHEYGGIELQVTTGASIEEIRTGGIRRRALKGEQEVERNPREVTKRTLGRERKTSFLVKIPKRSFMVDPYDRVEEKLFQIIEIAVAAMLVRL
jgi:hypothetical protein